VVSGETCEYFRDDVRNRHSGRQLDQCVARLDGLDGVRRFLPRSCLSTARVFFGGPRELEQRHPHRKNYASECTHAIEEGLGVRLTERSA
jgi:hypothetical protein